MLTGRIQLRVPQREAFDPVLGVVRSPSGSLQAQAAATESEDHAAAVSKVSEDDILVRRVSMPAGNACDVRWQPAGAAL